MIVRLANKNDLCGILELYTNLHDNEIPQITDELKKLWDEIITDNKYNIIVAEENGEIVSSCTCIIVPNLTHNQRPYAFIENVVTHVNHREKGYASACLDFAKQLAIESNCYKLMLMTGSKKESTLSFYRKAGYNSEDKTAFVMWIK